MMKLLYTKLGPWVVKFRLSTEMSNGPPGAQVGAQHITLHLVPPMEMLETEPNTLCMASRSHSLGNSPILLNVE